MHIEFEMSGGYGGLFAAQPLTYRVDLDTLPESERATLIELLNSSGIMNLPQSAAPGAPRGRDAMVYKLSITQAGATRTFGFDDVSAPAAVRPLLQYLQQQAIASRQVG